MILIFILSLILTSYAQINEQLTQEYDNGTLMLKVINDKPFQILFRIGEVQIEGVIQCHMCKCRSKFDQFTFVGCQIQSGQGHYDLRWNSEVPKSEAFLDENIMESYFNIRPDMNRLLQTNLTSGVVDISDMSSRYNMTSDFTIWWKFNNDTNQTFDMVIRWNRSSWLGIGLGPDMSNTDMWILYQQSTDQKVQIFDAWSVGEQTPMPDQIQSLTVISYNQTGQGFFIRIRRQLNTQDLQDTILKPGTQYVWCFAYSGAQTMEMHSDWFNFNMNFSNGIDAQADIFNSADSQFYAHAIILFISWGVIADIGVFVARFFKNINGYINIHTLCFLFVDLGTIIIGIIMLTKEYQPGVVEKQPGEVHEILAIILIGLVLLQHIAGVIIKVNIEASVKANKEYVLSMKKFHGISGTIIYLLAKVTMLTGFISNKKVVLLILYLIWILILIIIRIVLEIRRKKLRLIQTKVASSTQKLNHNQFTLINLLTQNTPTADIIKQLPDIDWVILNFDVYDMTGYQHPGGNFIIKSCQGREISRFFYGAYGLENTTIKRHKHSQQAIQSLDSRYIGTLVQQPDISKEETNVKTNQWNKVETIVLSENISQFQYQKDGKQFNLIQNLSDFGQHFTVSFSDFGGKVRMYTKVLSMSSPCVQYRKDIISFYDQFEQGKADRAPVLAQKITDTLPLIIKRYNYPKALSKQIFESSSPVFIEGPLGRGLELNSSGKNVAFIGGTGILPFMDLLDFLLKYTIHFVILQKNKGLADKLFNQDNQIQSTFGFKLCASFLNEEEFIGKDFIRKMYQINKQHNLHIFDIEIRYSDGKLDSVIPQIKTRFSSEYVKEQSNNADKIYVCGPPTMNYSVLQILENINVDQQKIVIV